MIFNLAQYLSPPTPLRLQVGRTSRGGSVITRLWRAADVAKCTLCPRCTASAEINGVSVCTISVPERVEPKDASRYYIPGAAPARPSVRLN